MIQVKEGFSGVYVVQVIFPGIVGGDGAVLADEIVNKAVGKFQVTGVFLYMVQFQHGLDHAAVNVVP